MKELILEYINNEFYYSPVDDCVIKTSTESYQLGYQQLETIVMKTFLLDEDIAHTIIFNWLLFNGAKSIKQNWNRGYVNTFGDITMADGVTSNSDNVNFSFTYSLINE